MQPFFTYYGGKWRAAPHYPKPAYGTIIEPFAGSAGYGLRYHDRNVILVDKDPTIVELWRYLIASSEKDILDLPLLQTGQSVDDFDVPTGGRHLIGFWLNKGTTRPRLTPSAWMRSGINPTGFWSAEIRDRIARQVAGIRHWTVIHGDYHDAPDIAATWFVDPPYYSAGRHYRFGSAQIDFTRLGEWCQSRHGQVLVCENVGATWLPFKHFRNVKSNESRNGKSVSHEALWYSETNAQQAFA
jgi:site-specific DNA-adenine methylase